MTPEFLKISTNEGEFFKAIYSILVFGKSEEEILLYEKHKPLLLHIENFIDYYQGKSNGEKHRIPIFLIHQADTFAKKIIIEYITIREGIFNAQTLDSIHSEIARDILRGGGKRPCFEVPAENSTARSKVLHKNIKCWIPKSNDGNIKYWHALKELKLHICEIMKNMTLNKSYTSSMLICRENEIPDGRYSLLPDFYQTQFQKSTSLFCNTTLSGEKFYNYLGEQGIEFDIDHPIHSNVFMFYSNTEKCDFSHGDLELLSQVGYHIDNQFVFAFCNHDYCLKSLINETSKLHDKYLQGHNLDNVFFFDEDEISSLNGIDVPTQNQIFIGNGEDFEIFDPEIRYLLEDLPYKYPKRNIMSLCATPAAEKAFFKQITEETPDYEIPESILIFDHIRGLWKSEIIPAIRDFCKDFKKIAFVIEWRTPEKIRKEIKGLLPEYTINFYTVQDLKFRKGKSNIKEKKIIRIRFDKFDENFAHYPNTYEPVPLKSNQEILDIIPLTLMARSKSLSENNIIRYLNKVMDNPYRKDCLGWIPIRASVDKYYSVDWDEEDSTRAPLKDQAKVEISFANGKKIIPLESTSFIYEGTDGIIRCAQAGDLIHRNVKAVQPLLDFELILKDFVSKNEGKDSAAEQAIRQAYIESDGIDDNPDIEIWRLLLKKRVEEKGADIVYAEISEKIANYEKHPTKIIDNWLNFKDKDRLLPRRKVTRNVFIDYVGIPRNSPYRGLVYRKKMRRIESSTEENRLLEQFLYAVIGKDFKEGAFDSLYANLQDALDLIDITNDADLFFIKSELEKSINLLEVNSISSYGE